EAPDLAVDVLVEVDLQGAMDVAAKAHVRVGIAELDPRPAGLERVQHLGFVVADAGDDTQSGDDNSAHAVPVHCTAVPDLCRHPWGRRPATSFSLPRDRQAGLDGLRFPLEQADLEILGLVDRLAVGLHDAVGDAEHQLAHAHALQVQVIADQLDGGSYHVGELHL